MRPRRPGPWQVLEKDPVLGGIFIMVDGETFRGTLETHSPEGGRHTVIVLRRDGCVWLVLNGAWSQSSVMTGREAEHLIALLGKAKSA